jgi:hypothetical protein
MMERLLASATNTDCLLDTTAAAKGLTTQGVHLTPAIRKPRRIGGGPQCRRMKARSYYPERDLVAWIETRLTAPVGSSDADAVGSRPKLLLHSTTLDARSLGGVYPPRSTDRGRYCGVNPHTARRERGGCCAQSTESSKNLVNKI